MNGADMMIQPGNFIEKGHEAEEAVRNLTCKWINCTLTHCSNVGAAAFWSGLKENRRIISVQPLFPCCLAASIEKVLDSCTVHEVTQIDPITIILCRTWSDLLIHGDGHCLAVFPSV